MPHFFALVWMMPKYNSFSSQNYFFVTVFDMFPKTPISAVEVDPKATPLPYFEHPENAVYVFGPEDGSLEAVQKRHCHQFVIIPTRHCTNLSAAIYIILYDRYMKQVQKGLELPSAIDCLAEPRGFSSEPLEFAKELVT